MEIPQILRLADRDVKRPAGEIPVVNAHLNHPHGLGVTHNRLPARVVDVPDVGALLRLRQQALVIAAQREGALNGFAGIFLRHIFHVVNRDAAHRVEVKALPRYRLRLWTAPCSPDSAGLRDTALSVTSGRSSRAAPCEDPADSRQNRRRGCYNIPGTMMPAVEAAACRLPRFLPADARGNRDFTVTDSISESAHLRSILA